MLGHSPRQKADADPSVLIPWLKEVILRPADAASTEIQVRLRGNILHVLCESSQSVLSRDFVLMRLVRSLQEPEIKTRFAEEFPQIYQVYVYSRKAPDPKPAWSAPIYLNRLDKHLERLVHSASDAKVVAKIAASANLGAVNSVPVNSDSEDIALPLPLTQSRAAAEVAEPPLVLNGASGETADEIAGEPAREVAQASVQESVEPVEVKANPTPEQLSDISLARKGDSGAIARYLSQSLSALNVGVKVSARVVPGKARRAKAVVSARTLDSRHEAEGDRSDSLSQDVETDGEQDLSRHLKRDLVSRLWVFCEADYSPDPLLIAEPIAERLRQLHLRQFQDAVITIQVTGEAASDWRLRVDLTPPEEMLSAWGRWGDIPALSMLVNQISRRYGLKLVTELKKSTLHLISYAVSDVIRPSARAAAPALSQSKIDIDGLVDDISLLLKGIAPQGVHRAMLYGPSTDDISPEWLRGIDLPAVENSELAKSAMDLACAGDLPALAYCLTRVLNPDIKEQLATGGIRVQLLQKDNLLHVMADGPVCPPKHAIVPLINETLEQANAVAVAEGVRLYGRRAGQKQPIWTHGQDYQLRARMVPEAKPEFAASEAYIGELITPVTDESLANRGSREGTAADASVLAMIARAVQLTMVKSQVFVPVEESSGLRSKLPRSFQTEGGKMALIWGAVGLFLAIQFDFMVGQALREVAGPAVAEVASSGAASGNATRGVERVKPNGYNDELASLEWNGSADSRQANEESTDGRLREESSDPFTAEDGFVSGNNRRFDGRDFTASAIGDDELIYSPQQEFISTSSLLAGSTLPSFRSQQLDEKLALYRRRVAQSGPPDVLLIGSSRTLRGVDPAALRQSLGATGNEGLSIFNFGVNGATAQVVDLIVRRLIPADQLPQMIVWADGARAFNSGRTDVTFDAIATSEGYRQLEASNTSDGINDLALGSLSEQLTARARSADQRMSELFGKTSSGYSNRGKIRTAIGQGFGAIAPQFLNEDGVTQTADTPTGAPTETSLIDFDGFLALSTRFNPATYYNDHARVAGVYDGDYKAFRLEGKQTEALENLLAYTVQKEVPVIFVNTPLTDEYLDGHRMKAEEFFVQYMVEAAQASENMTFRDLGQLWPQRYDYFSDPSHLNRYGAYQVSSRLAQDPLIPWPQPLPKEEIDP